MFCHWKTKTSFYFQWSDINIGRRGRLQLTIQILWRFEAIWLFNCGRFWIRVVLFVVTKKIPNRMICKCHFTSPYGFEFNQSLINWRRSNNFYLYCMSMLDMWFMWGGVSGWLICSRFSFKPHNVQGSLFVQ